MQYGRGFVYPCCYRRFVALLRQMLALFPDEWINTQEITVQLLNSILLFLNEWE